jgi:hypothetical protein
MKTWMRRICVTVVMVLLISYVLGSIDYWRVKSGEKPLFVLNWGGFFDGGSYAGGGLGYTVYSCHGVMYSTSHGQPDGDCDFVEGPAVDFWFLPFLNRSELKVTSHIKIP